MTDLVLDAARALTVEELLDRTPADGLRLVHPGGWVVGEFKLRRLPLTFGEMDPGPGRPRGGMSGDRLRARLADLEADAGGAALTGG